MNVLLLLGAVVCVAIAFLIGGVQVVHGNFWPWLLGGILLLVSALLIERHRGTRG